MKKGVKSKNQIIKASLQALNAKGNHLTLNKLAQEIGVSRGRINHFFPTRDSLFLTIASCYEKEFSKTQMKFHDTLGKHENKIKAVVDFYVEVMDLQFEYRSVILYIISQSDNEKVNAHTKNTFQKAKNVNRERLGILVDHGFLKPDILEPENFEPFFFQVSNLLTNWLVHYFLYESKKPLREVIDKYISGIMKLYYFYLTASGLDSYHQAMNDLNMKHDDELTLF